MTMESENEKYNKALNLLKKSTPELKTTSDIEREVIMRISKKKSPVYIQGELLDFLFGWIYIGWVRRSLIAASVLLISFFVWQQSVILKQVNFLSRQIIVTNDEARATPAQQVEKLLTIYKNSGKGITSRNITISEKQMNQILESVNELKGQYKDLIDLIDENPELKKFIEEKMNEKNNAKTKL
jgi:hypothetical protein